MEEISFQQDIDIEQIKEDFEDWINENLVIAAIMGFDSKKAPGPDEIGPKVLANLPIKTIRYLTFIYKACIKTGYTPKEWKKVRSYLYQNQAKIITLNQRALDL